jgi:predicted NBD/HSP70 family sugar kinase
MIDIAKNTEIKMAKLGDDAGIIGALALAKEEMAKKPKSKLGE